MKRQDLMKVINHYKVNNQLRKLNEEIWELQEAIITHELKKTVEYEIPLTEIIGTKEHIIEEISDVWLLLNEFKEYYEIGYEEIDKMMKYKLKRTIERMKDNDK